MWNMVATRTGAQEKEKDKDTALAELPQCLLAQKAIE